MNKLARVFAGLALMAPLAFPARGDTPAHQGEPVYESSVGGVIRAPSLAGAARQGFLVFSKWCSGCHAPDYVRPDDAAGSRDLPLPSRVALGTALLRQRYQGSLPAELERRTDLKGPVIAFYVRHGQNAMPPFRKTEITDAELAALVAYLARARPDQQTD